jgi:hypothetical protein
MFNKNFSIITAVGAATLMTMGIANAADLSFNAKELNGSSSYFGLAHADSDLTPISFMEKRSNLQTGNTRHGKTVNFDDPKGFLATYGNDYGYVRLETEVGYRQTDVKSMSGKNDVAYTRVNGNVEMGTALMNLAVEYSVDPSTLSDGVPSGFSVTPYVSVGGGVLGAFGDLNYKRNSTNHTESPVENQFFAAPAAQAGVGLTIGMPFGVEVFGGYSELLAFTYNYKDTNDIYIKTFSGGLRVNF